jgi:hypothetical protein
VIVAASTVAVMAIVVAILAVVLFLTYFMRGRRRRLQTSR